MKQRYIIHAGQVWLCSHSTVHQRGCKHKKI